MSDYLRREGALRATVRADLPAYAIAEHATDALLWTLRHAGGEAYKGKGEPPACWWRAKALMYLGVITLRTVRAAMAVLSVGYEAEIMGYVRTLAEARGRALKVTADRSGSYARQWLNRPGPGPPAGPVVDVLPKGLWDDLSHASHADPRAIENLGAIFRGDGVLNVAPERDVDRSNSSVAMLAGHAHAMAEIIAKEHKLTVPGLAEVEAALRMQSPWSEADDAP